MTHLQDVETPPKFLDEYLETASNVCLSGGANGADLVWGQHATLQSHQVIHWSFAGHPSHAPEAQIVRLSDEQLSIANETLHKAAKLLDKDPPKRPSVRRLLQRNYWQVAWSESVYAVSFLEGTGGTSWAIAMFRILHPERECYLFCQARGRWFRAVGVGLDWEEMEQEKGVPRPKGIWAGIGARELLDNGREAIRRVMSGIDSERVELYPEFTE